MKKLTLTSFLVAIMALISCDKNENENPSRESVNQGARLIENSKDVHVDAVFYNECCNEEVHVMGNAHILVTSNIIHFKVTDIIGTGISSGFTYQSLGASIDNNIFYSNQYEGSLFSKINMKNGNGCSFKMKVHFHTTVNANGEITTSFQNISTECN